ncbi:MAG: motility protein A [Rhodospirillaceae bacterium]
MSQKKAAAPARAPFNFSAAAGMVGGAALLMTAIGATAAEPWSFLNLPSLILVAGGTVAATLITYSFGDLGRACTRVIRSLQRETIVGRGDIERFAHIAALLKSGKLQDMEKETASLSSPFILTGVRFLTDGMPMESIGPVLEWRMRQQEALERSEAAVFRTMATYAPAFGMAGTLIGLVNMLRLMGAGATPAQIGTNLAFALITTLYGLVFANALLKPLAARIERKTHDHLRTMAAVVEAFRAIAAGHGPSHIREVLNAIAETHEYELGAADRLEIGAAGGSDGSANL